MKILEFLADHIFRFRYRDPVSKNDAGLITWDIDVAEAEQDKMLLDFFFMGFIIGAILEMIAAGILWLVL